VVVSCSITTAGPLDREHHHARRASFSPADSNMQVIVIMQVMSCCAASRHLLKDEFLRLDRRRSPLEELVRLSPLGVLPQIHREDEHNLRLPPVITIATLKRTYSQDEHGGVGVLGEDRGGTGVSVHDVVCRCYPLRAKMAGILPISAMLRRWRESLLILPSKSPMLDMAVAA